MNKKFQNMVLAIGCFALWGLSSPATVLAESQQEIENQDVYFAPVPSVTIQRYYVGYQGSSISASVIRDGYVYRGTLVYQGLTSAGYLYSGTLYLTQISPTSLE